MSYEGYRVEVCEDGHARNFDCYEDKNEFCFCGKKIAEIGYVDETNYLPYFVDFHLEVIKRQVDEYCPTCKRHYTVSPTLVKLVRHVGYGYNHDGCLYNHPLDAHGNKIPVKL